MLLRDFIKKLSEFDGDLPVVLSDWGEQHRLPCEKEAQVFRCMDDVDYTDNQGPFDEFGQDQKGRVLVIGSD